MCCWVIALSVCINAASIWYRDRQEIINRYVHDHEREADLTELVINIDISLNRVLVDLTHRYCMKCICCIDWRHQMGGGIWTLYVYHRPLLRYLVDVNNHRPCDVCWLFSSYSEPHTAYVKVSSGWECVLYVGSPVHILRTTQGLLSSPWRSITYDQVSRFPQRV